MQSIKSLLLGALLLSAACQDATSESESCRSGKCDGFGAIEVGQLMPRAPQVGAAISLSRNQDDWHFEVVGSQGEIVLLSENYASRASAINGALSVEENGVLLERYELRESGTGFAFTLRAANNQVLADSQVFESRGEAEAAMQAARDHVADIVQYKAALADGAKFDFHRPSGSEWAFTLENESGRDVLASQNYSRRRDAINGVQSVRANGKDLDRYEVLDSPPRFIIKAANGEEIATSAETFDSLDEAETAALATQELLVSERVANPW